MIDMALAATAYSVASALGASPKVMLSLFEAGFVESGWRNLGHQGAGNDHDSLGFLQQRPSQGWPDPMNPTTATTSYVKKAMVNERKYPNLSAGRLAQSVQVSAYPEKYDQREKEARDLIAAVSKGAPPPTGGGGGGASTPGNLLDATASAADALRTMATGVVNIGGLATTLTKLALPTNIIRACAGGVGIILLFAGILIIGREAKG